MVFIFKILMIMALILFQRELKANTLLKAHYFYHQKQYDISIELYLKAYQTSPSKELADYLSRSFAALGNNKEALFWLKQTIKLGEKKTAEHYIRQSSYEMALELPNVAQSVRQAFKNLKKDQYDDNAIVLLKLLLAKDFPLKSLSEIKKQLVLLLQSSHFFKSSLDAKLVLAQYYLNTNRLQQGVFFLKKIVKEMPSLHQIILFLTKVYLGLGQNHKAKELLLQTFVENSSYPLPLLDKIVEFLASRDSLLKKEVDLLIEIIKRCLVLTEGRPENDFYQMLLGKTYAKYNYPKKAKKIFDYLATRPFIPDESKIEIYYIQGILLHDQGDLQQSKEEFLKAITLLNKNAALKEAHYLPLQDALLRVMQGLNEISPLKYYIDKNLEETKKSNDLRAYYPFWQLTLLQYEFIYEARGNNDVTEAEFKERVAKLFLEIEKKKGRALLRERDLATLAHLLKETKNVPLYLQVMQELAQKSPGNVVYLALLAKTYLQQKDYNKARKWWRQATKIAPGHPSLTEISKVFGHP